MAEAGVNGVRIGEFAWSFYEPSPGELHFDKMDQALDILRDHSIRAIMCTCSRTPPPWFYKRYPEAVNNLPDGHENQKDDRYRIGLLHEAFSREAMRIDRAVVEHFAGHPAIQGWQVDNEVGSANDCFCDRCLVAFRGYLKEKYGSIEALNRAWGEHFWSYRFNDFDEVPLPSGSQPQAALEYRRFMSKINVDFIKSRVEMIHELDPGKWVTTNCQALFSRHTDWQDVCDAVDVPGMNHYPPRTPQLAIEIYRGQRDKLIALEQMTRLQPWDSGPGRMRLGAWMTIAHGATGINFFRWRQCRWGREQFADGLLPHSGKPTRFYDDLKRMGEEVRQIGEEINTTRVEADVAVMVDYPGRWAVDAHLYHDIDPFYEAAQWHDSLHRMNISTDAVDPTRPLDKYRLIVAPRLFMIDAPAALRLKQFVENGGTLLLTAGSGAVDEYGVSFDTPRPGPLAKLAGIEICDIADDADLKIKMTSATVNGLIGAQSLRPWDEIELCGAEAIATYEEGWRKGQPAVTQHQYGKGRVIYVGSGLDGSAQESLLKWLCPQANVVPILDTPEGVRAYERRSEKTRFLFLLNFTDERKSVMLSEKWKDALSGESVINVEINPVDLRILRAPAD